MRRSLVVSSHDVSPITKDATQNILADLASWGVERTSLLVIPDHHDKGHFLRDRKFCDWLIQTVRSGHEPVIHGYRHLRDLKPKEGVICRLTTRFYTAGEGEFYDIDRDQAWRRASQARLEFRSLGMAPTGFIAPAWLLGNAAEEALRELGFLYTVRLGSVLYLQTKELLLSQSLVYSTRAWWRRRCSLLWNRFLKGRLLGNPLMRLSIHPPDFRHRAVRAQIERIVKHAMSTGRAPSTYGALFAMDSA